jgi:hypothetical protein
LASPPLSKWFSRRSQISGFRLLALLLLLLTTDAVQAETRLLETSAAGATLYIHFATPVGEQRAALLARWLQDTAGVVGSVYGRFPLDELGVFIVPQHGDRGEAGSPVPFGRVTRRGGEKVELYVDVNRPLADLYSDWTATHEFSHLLLPRISWRQRWISEGFASYYQNVLMARAGFYSTDTAIDKLSAGFERGRKSRPELSPNDAAREGVRRARYKIYWSGAAIALRADLALRDGSNGEESLDVVLGRFRACCLPSRRTWSGEELFTKLDSLATRPVFMPLYRQYADRPGFPDIERALADPRVRTEIFAVRTSPN